MEDVETTVLDFIAKKASVERSTLSRATEIASLNLQSIDILEIMFEVEEKYDISLIYNPSDGSSAAGGGFKTVGDVLDLVVKQIEKPA